ncbi:MAG TPA: heme lyase CcmF/NrfE family subunit [Verrucomicrobiae bacterium]|nr:heme lyase CcmF/NrfE family subunit [Verrucomicrobiae bacterium]
MIAELGHFALILALGVSALQALLPLYGWRRGDARALAAGRSGALTQFALVALAYVCLSLCFVNGDFSVAYVAANSHTDLPLMYRLTAVWGGHEGSLLLWMLMLSGWTFAVSLFNRNLPDYITALVLAVLGAIGVGFLLFMLTTSNPFDRHFPVPLEGRDLNPLLQDPGMIIHPPMLYMGYVGFSVAFAFAIAALLSGKLDTAWARWTRPWTTAAWMFLTLGITLGSWWAYHELGWGGWWFWDPVENASFMPWLVGTALIHSLAVTEKRGLLKSWTVLLALLAFALSLLGTFLVRSGVLVSVHAFATDPARGVFILAFLTVVIGSALGLYAWRARIFVTTGELQFLSREGLLLFNNVFLVSAAAAVLLGTLYPLAIEALNLGKLSVGPPYFNAVFVPLTAPLAVLIGLAACVPWKNSRGRDVLRLMRGPAAFAVVCAIGLPFLLQGRNTLVAVAGTLLATWAMATAGQELLRRARSHRVLAQGLASIPRGVWGMSLAHFGIGVFVLGVTHVSTFGAERDVRLAPGQEAALGAYTYRLIEVRGLPGPNYDADVGTIEVSKDGQRLAVLQPEKRLYRAQRNVMTEAAVDHTLLRDLYVALGEPFNNGDWSVRLYYRPTMRLVWLGGVLAFLGGLLAMSDRRYRLAQAAARAPDPSASAPA